MTKNMENREKTAEKIGKSGNFLGHLSILVEKIWIPLRACYIFCLAASAGDAERKQLV